MKRRIEISRQGNFILALLLIHFIFFGYICLIYPENVGIRLIFLYKAFFDRQSFISLLILIAIVFIMVIREDFYEYGIRNSIWLTPVIVLESWFWYMFVNDFDFTFIIDYFTMFEGYLTIITLFCVNFFTAILAAYVKIKWEARVKGIQELKINI